MNAEKLREMIDASERIVALTGAGISCASGIPDFRSANGLYGEGKFGGYRPEDIISHWFLTNRPEEFFDYYKKKMIYPDAKPNAAHFYLADLEKQGKLKAVVTQNIDDLHGRAGSERVYELHGSVMRNYCADCGKRFGLDYVMSRPGAPRCDACGGIVRPDVVLYGEGLDGRVWNGAIAEIERADCLIAIGTSLTVYPASSLFSRFRGDRSAIVNNSRTEYDAIATVVLHEDIISVIEELKKGE